MAKNGIGERNRMPMDEIKERQILFGPPMVRAILRTAPEADKAANNGKTQTRRIINHQPPDPRCMLTPCTGTNGRYHWVLPDGANIIDAGRTFSCPYGYPGDRLWVREAWAPGIHALAAKSDTNYHVVYGADPFAHQYRLGDRWKPSIHMPRWASRITLGVVNVRAEPLQDITEEDAIAEGIYQSVPMNGMWTADGDTFTGKEGGAIGAYRALWNSINLPPTPLTKTVDGKKQVVGYESYPWCAEDFDAQYRGVRVAGVYRGKPITVIANPWVWVIEFKQVQT